MKNRSLFTLGLLLAGVLLFPDLVQADNCSGFGDCFSNAKVAAAAAAAAAILAAVASAAADLTPGVGEGKAAIQFATGEDPFTHEKIPRWQSAVGLIPVFGRIAARGIRMSMAVARAGKAMQTARVLRTTAKWGSKGIDVYEKVRQPYDVVNTVKETSGKIAGHLTDYVKNNMPSSSSESQPKFAGTTVRNTGTAGGSGQVFTAHAVPIPYDQFLDVLTTGFNPVPGDAPAVIAQQTLKDLAKSFGKDSQVLKNLAKAKDELKDLPEEATMSDVMKKLKS